MPNAIVTELINRVAKLEGKMSVVMGLVTVGTGAALATFFAVLMK